MLKKVGYVTGGIVGVIIILVIGLELYFTSDRLKAMVEPPLEEAIQRDVKIGSMSLEFIRTFPQIGVSMNDFIIPGPRQDTAASMQEIVIGVELFPLLQSQVNLSELTIVSPMVHYKIYEDGSSNFDFEPTEPEETPADTAASAMNLNVPQITISNGNFAYTDMPGQAEAAVTNLSGTIGLAYADVIETNVDLAIEGLTYSSAGTEYVQGLPLSIKETSTINLEKETITLKKGGMAIKGLQLNINGTISDWSAEAPRLDLDFQTSSDQFGELLKLIPESYQQQIGAFDAGGALAFSGSVKGHAGGEELPAINANLKVSDAFMQHPDLKGKISEINIQADITNEKISINQFGAVAGPNSLSATGTVLKPLGESPVADIQTNTRVDLASIPNFYPVDTDTLNARGNLRVDLVLKGEITQPDKMDINGSFDLKNGYLAYYNIGKPLENISISGKIEDDRLNLRQFNVTSGGNSLSITGLINKFQSDNPQLDVAVNAAMDLGEVTAYYSLKPYINEMAGNMKADLKVKGPAAKPEALKVSGSLLLNNASFSGDSLPTAPVTNLYADINLSPVAMDIRKTELHVGPSDIVFSGTVNNYMDLAAENITRPVQIRGQLSSKLFNYDAIFPVEDSLAAALEPIPMDIPNIDAQIDINADSIVYMGIGFNDAIAKLTVTKNNITVKDARTGIMSGSAIGTLVWTIPDPLATSINFKGSVDSVAARRFFSDFHVLGEESSFYKHIKGDFNATVDYTTDMDKYLEPVIQSTQAKGHFGMSESLLENHPAQLALARFLSADDLKKMKLDKWQADYTIKDGVMELKNMKLSSGKLAMELEGTQNLVSDELNYKATLWVPQKYAGNLSKIISARGVKALTQEDGRVKVPLRITGTSDDVKYRPDEEMIKDLMNELLKEKVKNKIGNIFGDG